MAGTAGAQCAAQSMAFSAQDAGTFTWSSSPTLSQSGTARLQVSPAGAGAYTTLASASVRTSGQRTIGGALTSLGTGSWDWRMLVTEWDGTSFSCSGPAFSVLRLPAPSVGLSGAGITSDGWRTPKSGQVADVVPAAADVHPGTGWVRFRYANGTWSNWTSSPAGIPGSDVTQVQAYRRTTTLLKGIVSTTGIQKDTAAPSAPDPAADRVAVGADGGSVAFAASEDAGSGVDRYESLVVDQDGTRGAWQPVNGLVASVGPGTAGGTLLLRSCDRVDNCSTAVGLSLVPMSMPSPITDPGDGDPGTSPTQPSPGRGARGDQPRTVAAAPRIISLVASSPRGGAGRVTVDLSRPAEVTFMVGGTPVARVWLGAGRTAVRLPAMSRATRGTLTARPVAGSATGAVATTTISLPGGGRRGEAARRATRMRAGAAAVLYDVDAAVREVVQPSDGSAGLGHSRGALRQEPSTSGLFSADDATALVGKITEEDIRGLGADEIADVIREAIDDAPGHLVGFDELTPAEADPRAPMVRGGRIPPADPSSPGAALAGALQALDVPSPYGGTWADRVHVYIAPAVTSAMAAGLGPDRNLGRDGKPHFATYRTVMAGLARAGAVWIEAYHGATVPLTPFTVREWKRAPAAFTAEYRRAGGDPSRLHFLLTGPQAFPAGALPPACTTPQACQWALAEGTAAGRAIIANGVGGYRLGDTARPWLAEWQARVS